MEESKVLDPDKNVKTFPVRNRHMPIFLAFTILGCLFWMSKNKNIIDAFYAAIYDNGKPSNNPDEDVAVIYSFSTPHEKTWEFLDEMPNDELIKKSKIKKPMDKSPGSEDRDIYTTTSADLEAFEDDLRALGVQGFNRWPVWGSGSRPTKPMWMWTVTATAAKPVSIPDILLIYEKNFKRKKGIYIEETHVGKTIYSN